MAVSETPYGSVEEVHAGDDLEARWIFKEDEELCVAEGSLQLELEGREPFVLHSGDLFVIPPTRRPRLPLAPRWWPALQVPRRDAGGRDLHSALERSLGRYVLVVDDDDVRTESQKEWAAWAAHGYRKLYQPRSMLWFGGIFLTLFAAGLVAIFWLAGTGRWP